MRGGYPAGSTANYRETAVQILPQSRPRGMVWNHMGISDHGSVAAMGRTRLWTPPGAPVAGERVCQTAVDVRPKTRPSPGGCHRGRALDVREAEPADRSRKIRTPDALLSALTPWRASISWRSAEDRAKLQCRTARRTVQTRAGIGGGTLDDPPTQAPSGLHQFQPAADPLSWRVPGLHRIPLVP